MKKYRIAFTIQDYYNYFGTSSYSIKERMLKSIPKEFEQNGYNIKFKHIRNKLYPYYNYRIHMSVRMTEEEIDKVFEKYKNTIFRLSNTSCKLITKHF